MKKIVFPLIICATALISFAQNNVGIGTNSPAASAVLDITSTTKGLLIPRMTTVQRNAVVSPAKGLLVFDTDNNALYIFDGAVWASYKPQGSGNPLSLPYQNTGSYSSSAFLISNQHTTTTAPTFHVEAVTGHALQGTSASNFYSGVYGENSGTGKGVSGLNTGAGHGVHARGTDGTALYADIPSGTGTAGRFRQTNAAGKALEAEGNVRIFGGNTSPGEGKVLTSDANGNATWQVPNANGRIGFTVRGIMGNGANVIANATLSKIHFEFEEADFGNNYNASLNAPSSTFIVPVTGLYHMSASVTVAGSQSDIFDCRLQMIKFSPVREEIQSCLHPGGTNDEYTLHVEGDYILQAGQSVWTEFVANVQNNATTELERSKSKAHFSCHLVMAQ